MNNIQNLNFGKTQTNYIVNHVILPKWAKSSRDFIRIMRCALESDYVSQNLHNWIDLIFGYKQNGDEAIKADNLFHCMTYETYLDELKTISKGNTSEEKGHIQQLQGFGQTPKQLFKKPHSSKRALKIIDSEGNLDNTSNEMVQISANLLRNEKKEKECEKFRRAKDKELDKITGKFNEISMKRNDKMKKIKE